MAKCNFTREQLTAGKAMFTVYNGVDNWFTFKLKPMNCSSSFSVDWFAGSDNANEGSYVPLGLLHTHDGLALEPMEAICRKCKAWMRLRTNRKTNEQFWGCSNYPECTATREKDARFPNAVQAFNFALRVISGTIQPEQYSKAEVMHVARCCRCRRLLTTPESIKSLIGPECAGREAKTPTRHTTSEK